jgi:hypothetical protein
MVEIRASSLFRWILLAAALFAGCADGDRATTPIPSGELWEDIRPPYPPVKGSTAGRRLAVILDPGHGGIGDRGTRFTVDGIESCEDALVRDVTRRLEGALSSEIRIQVAVTVVDAGATMDEAGRCHGTEAALLQRPDGTLQDIRPPAEGGLELRAAVITEWFQHFLREGFGINDIILLSLHIDHNRPHRQGANILFPGLVYEQMESGAVSTAWASMTLATYVLYGLERAGVLLHVADDGGPAPFFRGYVTATDDTSGPVPGRLAIFRDTPPVPKILVEIANGAHVADRARIARSEYREKVAKGLAKGLVFYLER